MNHHICFFNQNENLGYSFDQLNYWKLSSNLNLLPQHKIFRFPVAACLELDHNIRSDVHDLTFPIVFFVFFVDDNVCMRSISLRIPAIWIMTTDSVSRRSHGEWCVRACVRVRFPTVRMESSRSDVQFFGVNTKIYARLTTTPMTRTSNHSPYVFIDTSEKTFNIE